MSAIGIVRFVWKETPNDAQAYRRVLGQATQTSEKSVFCKVSDVADITILHLLQLTVLVPISYPNAWCRFDAQYRILVAPSRRQLPSDFAQVG